MQTGLHAVEVASVSLLGDGGDAFDGEVQRILGYRCDQQGTRLPYLDVLDVSVIHFQDHAVGIQRRNFEELLAAFHGCAD